MGSDTNGSGMVFASSGSRSPSSFGFGPVTNNTTDFRYTSIHMIQLEIDNKKPESEKCFLF